MRVEQQLARSIRDGAPRVLQLQLAEEVRLARIRALRSIKATFIPKAGGQINQGATLDAKIAFLESITPEAIFEESEGAARVERPNRPDD